MARAEFDDGLHRRISSARVSPIGEYFQAWNEPDVDRRRELLERSVTAEIELVHPSFGRSR